MAAPRIVQGVPIPPLLYGTAWKEERTAPLVGEALAAGFRGFDTANQRKHYHEAGVGEAIGAALRAGAVARDDLFLQTKFTYVRGQDHRLPYDPDAPIGEQVRQSFESSLAHLGVDRLDAYLLHGPWGYPSLAQQDLEAWVAMEELQRAGRVRLIGISNVLAGQLSELWEHAQVKPALVQNRTLVMPGVDLAVRTFCRERGMGYEGFSLLTAAPQLLAQPVVREVAARLGTTPAAAALRLVADQGIVVLTGTTSSTNMRRDLAALGAAILPAEAEAFGAMVPAPR